MLQVPSNWIIEDDHLARQWELPDFAAALKLTNKIGALAEQADHHPDIELGYGKLVVRLRTHSANAITDKDYQLARLIEAAC